MTRWWTGQPATRRATLGPSMEAVTMPREPAPSHVTRRKTWSGRSHLVCLP